jgi:hypothetical protein
MIVFLPLIFQYLRNIILFVRLSLQVILLLCIQYCKNFFFFFQKLVKNQKEAKTGNEKYATMGIVRS